MSNAVIAATIAVAATNSVSALLGGLLWYRGAPPGRPASNAFWVLLRVGQGSALMLAIAVGSLAAAGNYPSERLFYLYALLPLAVGFLAEQLRVSAAQTILDQRGLQGSEAVGGLPEEEQRMLVTLILRREMAVMAVSALVVVFLALRAAGTAHGF